MTQKITPFLMFNDQAAEAMEFYVSLFPNSRIVSTLPAPDGSTAGGSFELNGQRLMCYNGGPKFKFEQGLSLMYSAETQDEIDHIYEGLADGGGEAQPCSWVVDKFGVSWQIVPPILLELLGGPDHEKAGRVAQAMSKMTKIIIADLEAAAA